MSGVRRSVSAFRGPISDRIPPLVAAALFSAGIAAFYAPVWQAGPRAVVPATSPAGLARLEPELERTDIRTYVDRLDATFAAWLVSRHAYTVLHRPWRLSETEHCAPAERTLALGAPMLTLGLLGAPVRAVSGDPILTYNLALALSWLVGAMAVYFLVRAFTASAFAGLAAGFFYTFHPLHTRDITHAFGDDMAWTALALLFAERWLSRGRFGYAVALAACVALQAASSFYPLVAALLLSLPFAVWLLVRDGLDRTRGLQLAAIAAFVALAAGFLFAPYLSSLSAPDLPERAKIYMPWSSLLPGGPRFIGWTAAALLVPALLLRRRDVLPGVQGDPRPALLIGALLVTLAATGGTAHAEAAGADVPVPLPNLYALLASLLPGFDAVRGVDRIAIGLHLAVAIFVGVGFAGVQRSLPRVRAQPLVLAALLGIVCFGALRPGLFGSQPDERWEVLRLRPREETLAFFDELARLGNQGPLLELPADRLGFGAAMPHILRSSWHHRRTSACFGSYVPEGRDALIALSERLPDPDALREVRRLGFTTVVLHEPRGGALRRRFDRQAGRDDGLLRLLHETPARSAYEIAGGRSLRPVQDSSGLERRGSAPVSRSARTNRMRPREPRGPNEPEALP